MSRGNSISNLSVRYGLILFMICLLASWTSLYAQSLQLNGDLDYASIDDVADVSDPADRLDVSDNTFTLEMWVNHDGDSDENARLIDKTQGSATDGGYEVYFVGSSETPQVRINVPATFTEVTSDQGIPADRWTHLAFTYDGNEIAIYINGEKNGSASPGGDVEGNALPFVVGANTGKNGQFFSGAIDDIRLWQDGRELIEIRNNLYKSLSGNESGLVAYYPFDNLSSASSTIEDAVGPADLTLRGDYAGAGMFTLYHQICTFWMRGTVRSI